MPFALNTPVGIAFVPDALVKDYLKLSNDELIDTLINQEKKTNLIDPVLLQLIINKGLYNKLCERRNKSWNI